MVMQRRFVASEQRRPGRIHVLLVTTGSVASIKAPLIVRELMKVCQETLGLRV
jgi:phosphopantothenoylcysteine decarboxylase